MRDIKWIVFHCTAGSAQQKTSDIIAYWKRKLGWKRYGYHHLVNEDGSEENITPIQFISNGVAGYNDKSIHICYKGGWNGTDTRTDAQKKKLLELATKYKKMFPNAIIVGHRDLSPDLNKDGVVSPNEWVKLCPCFSARTEYTSLSIVA